MIGRTKETGGAKAKVDKTTTPPPASASGTPAAATGSPAVVVVLPDGTEPRRFAGTFRIGRGEECEVRFDREDISRSHAEVAWEDGVWIVRDLQSTNGTLLDGKLIERAQLPRKATVGLGKDGPQIEVVVESGGAAEVGEATIAKGSKTVSFYAERYLDGSVGEKVGERTEMIRRAFRKVMGQRRRRYFAVIGLVTLLFFGAGAFSVWQNKQLARQRKAAEEMFYGMKSMELQLTKLEERLSAVGDAATRSELEAGRARFAELQRSYDKFLREIDVYSEKMTEQERTILRIARVFGECEAAVPKHITDEVQRYITKWQADQRLTDAIKRDATAGYRNVVVRAMLDQHLPPQFYYVVLQESDFKVDVCGPETRWGIAKGPWQLIPSTAIAYGLKTGPLYLVRQPDPRDERHDFDKATAAAARYLRDIYSKEAQASGLLVVASYNWGESAVRGLIRTMPENPRERNFWRLWVDHRRDIPRQTYHYVFRIFAAAVIGENPKLFGFDFVNPLAEPLAKVGS
jgi:membrane-bound lytic murein transglycosylase D